MTGRMYKHIYIHIYKVLEVLSLSLLLVIQV